MSNNRRKLRLNTVSVSLGCSSGLCRRPKLSSFFTPKPKPKHHHHQSSRSTSSWQRVNSHSHSHSHSHSPCTTTTTNSSSNVTWTNHYCSDPETRSSRAVQGFGRIGGESLAVEKDSDDPYLDFRSSMVQMIMEKEIYSKEDLKELLNCFLQLNSPYYHGIIVRAFTEIWHSVFFGK